MFGLAGEDGTNLNLLDGRLLNNLANLLCEFFTSTGNKLTRVRMVDIVN
jgi:hypothetical protein